MYAMPFRVGQRLANTWKVFKKWSEMIISINDTGAKEKATKKTDSRGFEKQPIVSGTASETD